MSVTGSGDHVFGRVRPSHGGDFQLSGTTERYSKPHVIEKKKSARAASNASW
jgi:hypothetical protein